MSTVENFVEIRLKTPDDFLKVKETLTRMGVASSKHPTLYQSCHILHKQGKFYITHFKEMFLLDGKATTLDEADKARRNTVVMLLKQWGLVDVVDEASYKTPAPDPKLIRIIPFKDKGAWTLVPKYTIGKKIRP